MDTKGVYRNNNMSFDELNELPDPKKSELTKSELTKSGEDDEFEYYKVQKKKPKSKEIIKPEKSETIENNDDDYLMKNISLDNIPDIRDVSFNGKSLAGGSSLNLRF